MIFHAAPQGCFDFDARRFATLALHVHKRISYEHWREQLLLEASKLISQNFGDALSCMAIPQGWYDAFFRLPGQDVRQL